MRHAPDRAPCRERAGERRSTDTQNARCDFRRERAFSPRESTPASAEIGA